MLNRYLSGVFEFIITRRRTNEIYDCIRYSWLRILLQKNAGSHGAGTCGTTDFTGDLLYHGPRNDLPREYAPKEVIAMLNERKNCIYNVRGNCDAQVDQMVLEFPVLAEYGFFEIDGKTIYCSHGHVYNERIFRH